MEHVYQIKIKKKKLCKFDLLRDVNKLMNLVNMNSSKVEKSWSKSLYTPQYRLTVGLCTQSPGFISYLLLLVTQNTCKFMLLLMTGRHGRMTAPERGEEDTTEPFPLSSCFLLLSYSFIPISVGVLPQARIMLIDLISRTAYIHTLALLSM